MYRLSSFSIILYYATMFLSIYSSKIILIFKKFKKFERRKKGLVIFSFISILISTFLILNIFFDPFTENIIVQSNPENWKEFIFKDEGFKAVFPYNFVISPQPEFYQIEDDEISFYTTGGENNLSYFIITSPCENCDNPLIQQESLKKHLNYLSSSIDVDDTSSGAEELLYSINEYFLDYLSIKFLIKDKAMNVYSKGYLFSANQKIYTVMVMFIGGFYNDIDYQKFINSFQLLSMAK